MEFDWRPEKATENLEKHRVSFHEAATVLEDPLSTTFPDEVHSEDEVRFVTIGASTRGRGTKRHDPHHQRPSSDKARASIL